VRKGRLATVCPMADTWLSDTRASYDADADGYTEKVRGLLDERPYLRASLALFAELVERVGGGPVADVGCGPGYVTDHLHDLGVDAFGIDLSSEMTQLPVYSRSGPSSTSQTPPCPKCSKSSAGCCVRAVRYWPGFTWATRRNTRTRVTQDVRSPSTVTDASRKQ
jgi:SAM-dependent methyltransferase